MTTSPSEQAVRILQPAAQATDGDLPAHDALAVSQAVRILADARAECVALGVDPDRLGTMLLDEAMLSWLIAGWSERDVRERLLEAMGRDVRQWFGRARVATGQCDCVQEVQLAGQMEAEALGLRRLPGMTAAWPRDSETLAADGKAATSSGLDFR